LLLRLSCGDESNASAIMLNGSKKKEIKKILNTIYY